MRVPQLDALRGIAAFSVVIHHAIMVMSPDADPAKLWKPLEFLPTGRPDVILFFVLSGFVLTLSLAGQSYPGFAVRRLLRLGIPFAAAVLFALALRTSVQPSPIADQSKWFNEFWANDLTVRGFAAHLLMRGHWADASLNAVLWSLWYETRISLLLPLMVSFATRQPTKVSVLLFGGIAVVTTALTPNNPIYSYSAIEAVTVTGYFILPFAIGMALALRPVSLPRFRVGLCAIALLLMSLGSDLFTCAGAALLICLAIDAGPWLYAPPLKWLGRVSFSLYLFHLPIMMAMVYALHPYLTTWSIMLAATAISMIVAEIAYRTIERPSIDLGRSVGKLIAQPCR